MDLKERAAMQQALEALESCNVGNWSMAFDEFAVVEAITALREALAEQAKCKECGAKQAQIDRLMLECCPDEMTPEQMREWGNNQRPAEQEKPLYRKVLREMLDAHEQAEQEPFKMICPRCKVDRVTTQCPNRGGIGDCPMTATAQSAAPVRTKDLTDAFINELHKDAQDPISFARAVIAADREKNK